MSTKTTASTCTQCAAPLPAPDKLGVAVCRHCGTASRVQLATIESAVMAAARQREVKSKLATLMRIMTSSLAKGSKEQYFVAYEAYLYVQLWATYGSQTLSELAAQVATILETASEQVNFAYVPSAERGIEFDWDAVAKVVARA